MSARTPVRLTLQNLSTTTKTFSLEPYGDYCEVPPDTTLHATWSFPDEGEAELEIVILNDGVTICDASTPMHELAPRRDAAGGDLWQ